jgi:Fe-S-cluster containining protein
MPENGKKIVSKNTWTAKGLRFFTSFLPIAPNRTGSCKRCGACCQLPTKCLFLSYDRDGNALCKIYPLRSFSCRKYPRTSDEHITGSSCGFSFPLRRNAASKS